MKISFFTIWILFLFATPFTFAQNSTTQTATLKVPQLNPEIKEQAISKPNFHILLDLSQFHNLNLKTIENENAAQWLKTIASGISDKLKAKQFQVTIYSPANKVKTEERLAQIKTINSNLILQIVPKVSHKSPISVTQIYFPSNLFDGSYSANLENDGEESIQTIQRESELFLDTKTQISLLAGLIHKNFQNSEIIKTATPLPIPIFISRRINKPSVLIEIGYQEIDYKLGFTKNKADEFAVHISKSIIEYHSKTN